MHRQQLPKLTVMKKLKGHTNDVYNFCVIRFSDGKNRIVTSSRDQTIRIFNENGTLEETQHHSHWIFSILYVERTSQILTTDYNGELLFWNLNRNQGNIPNRIQFMKRTKVARPESVLGEVIQVSPLCYVCCAGYGPSKGNLYRIRFQNLVLIKSCGIIYPPRLPKKEKKREGLHRICQLKTQKDWIIIAGGDPLSSGGKDFALKKLNWKHLKHDVFPLKHTDRIDSLSSFVSRKYSNEEIILSGSLDNTIIFWSLKGRMVKEVKCESWINCFLFDREFKTLFFGSYTDLVILDLGQEKVLGRRKLHERVIHRLKWLDETQTNLVSCSEDFTLSIVRVGSDPVERTAPVVPVEEEEKKEEEEKNPGTPLTDRNTCTVCMERKKIMCVLPCGHLCLCFECSEKIKDKCVICRGKIDSYVRVFQ